ncbi:MAG: hypothetical protein R3207_11445, partial [Oceanospirillum sp.]|nr:hypothetical protein [Oceanospirillum sp.]
QFDPLTQRLRGERSGRVYGMNDELTVIVARVDLDERKIDFELDTSQPDNSVGRKRKPRKRNLTDAEARLAKVVASNDSGANPNQKSDQGDGSGKPKHKGGRKKKLKPAEKGRAGLNDAPKRKRPKKKKAKKD